MQEQPTEHSRPEQEEEAWLTRVQEQSWEPEIIISGIVLFALFQIPALIEQLGHFLTNYSLSIFSSGTADELLLALIQIANVWLIAGFMVHLFLRSVWVAYVGLSYVYKDGIQVSRLKFQERYNRLLFQDKGFRRNIRQLEEICSTTFAVSFLLFMCVLGAFFFLLIVALLIALAAALFPDTHNFGWVDPALVIIGLLFIVDFVSLGYLKRIPYFSRAYYPIYRVMSWLTLSPFYRRIYYGLISNHKKWKARLFMLAFIVLSGFMAFSIRNENNIASVLAFTLEPLDKGSLYAGNYNNLADGEYSNVISIPSDIISEPVLRVFIVHRTAYEERQIKPLCEYDQKVDTMEKAALHLECLSAFYGLRLDGEELEAEYLYHHSPQRRQDGLLAYIDIQELAPGLHELELIYNFYWKGEVNPRTVSTVEFYKVAEQ